MTNHDHNRHMTNQEGGWDVSKAPGPRWQIALLTHGDDDTTDLVLLRRTSPHTSWQIQRSWTTAGPDIPLETPGAALKFANEVVGQALRSLHRSISSELALLIEPF